MELFGREKPVEKKIDVCYFGLGNPGKEYEHTRHNIGFRVIDRFNSSILREKKKVKFSEAEVVKGIIGENIIVATVKPLTYMNRSGSVVAAVIKKWNIPLDKCMVVVDDFNIPFGTIRARKKGSDGGHNGMKSIIERIGEGFPRLRVGIGPLPENVNVTDFVLGNFRKSEEKELEEIITRCCNALEEFAINGIEKMMNKYNN